LLDVTLRSATDQDSAFVFLVKKAALGRYIEQTWGWDEEFQLQFHEKDYDPSETNIIVESGRDVGWMVVTEGEQEFLLQEIYLHPDHHGQGIGSYLVRQLLAKADREHKTVKLTVLKVNTRARQLYERLGFKKTGETEHHHVMQAGHHG
jgi:ribosomal protein S18 acetylase RimI-like enzyme